MAKFLNLPWSAEQGDGREPGRAFVVDANGQTVCTTNGKAGYELETAKAICLGMESFKPDITSGSRVTVEALKDSMAWRILAFAHAGEIKELIEGSPERMVGVTDLEVQIYVKLLMGNVKGVGEL